MKTKILTPFYALSRVLNVLLHPIPMPQNTRLGSGHYETLCVHMHRLSRQGIVWAQIACAVIDAPFPHHCEDQGKLYDDFQDGR